jgi:hypothetical protein
VRLTLSKDLQERVDLSRSNHLPLASENGADAYDDCEDIRKIPESRYIERGKGLLATAVGTLGKP